MWPLRALAHLLCVLALVLAASGCGGAKKSYSGTEPSVWAATVCGAVGDWNRELQVASARNGPGLGGTDLKVVKLRAVALLESAERSTRTMVTTIAAAGAPAVKDGAAIQKDLVSGLQGARMAFTHAVARAKALSTTRRRKFQAGVQALAGDVQNELISVGGSFNTIGDKYEDETLNEAISEEPSCESISG